MTDNEIIKALECLGYCDRPKPKKEILIGALDLINRQKADYEALKQQEEKSHLHCKNVCEPKYKAEIKRYKNAYEQVKWESDMFSEDLKKAKAEIERLKTLNSKLEAEVYRKGLL